MGGVLDGLIVRRMTGGALRLRDDDYWEEGVQEIFESFHPMASFSHPVKTSQLVMLGTIVIMTGPQANVLGQYCFWWRNI